MEQKRTWIYCRVAHSGPDSEELLAGQRHRLEGYAKEHGFEIIGCSSDIGSGLTLDRPGLQKFMDAVEDEAVDVLLLPDLARLGRDIDKVVQLFRTPFTKPRRASRGGGRPLRHPPPRSEPQYRRH